MDNTEFWNQILTTVQENVGSQCFNIWFRPIFCSGVSNGALHLVVPSEGFRSCLMENYTTLLLKAAGNISHEVHRLEITIRNEENGKDADAVNSVEVASPNTADAAEQSPSSIFNPKYTFDSFVVGSSNEFAHAAARNVAEKPAQTYNPLYLYGGPGLGKTHLMHAIGNLIRQRNSSIRMCYISTEKFTNDFINAVKNNQGNMLEFRQRYRNIDILLIDDIQFLATREQTKVEFFNTFNALYEAHKQIVIASDCAPKYLPNLEERLRSRFECGLIADIQPPDFETKLAILKEKAAAEQFDLIDEVATFIASGIKSNVRELEGALTRLCAHASLNGRKAEDIDLSYAKEVLKCFIADDSADISSDTIIRAVANHFALKPAQIKARSNAKPIVEPRQIAMYLCRVLTHQSLPQIGKIFEKDHTTAMHAIKKVDSRIKVDPEFSTMVKKIGNSLR